MNEVNFLLAFGLAILTCLLAAGGALWMARDVRPKKHHPAPGE